MSDISEFVDGLVDDMVLSAPSEVRDMVLADEGLRDLVLAFQGDVRDGLEAIQRGLGTVADLERSLRARKTAILARAGAGHFTIEKILAGVIQKVLARART